MKFCLGTVQFGMDYGVQGARKPEYSKVVEILDYAFSQDIVTYDSAATYGEAENIIGFYIRNNPDRLINAKVVSKLSSTAFEGARKEMWAEIAVENAKKSKQALGVNVLEAYLFHNASMINDTNAVRAISEVKKQGISNKVGVSVYSPGEAMRALDYDEIEVIQVPYNVLDHRLDQCGFFRAAQKRNVDVYARSTLLQGLLVMDADSIPSNMGFARPYLRIYHQICEKYSMSPLHAAIGYVLRHPKIDYIVFGVDSLTQLKEYISIQEAGIPVEMAAEMNTEFDEVEERIVNPVLWK